jgi:hypothetical protein
VVLGGTVECRVDDLPLDGALHVRHLFGSLVDEQHDEVTLGVVGGDRVGDLLHDRRLARLGGRHDHASLALADGGDQVDDALRDLARGVRQLQVEPILRVQRRQLLEPLPADDLFRRHAIDLIDPDQRLVLLPFLGPPDCPHDVVATTKL